MEIKLDFNENEIDMLHHTRSASFVLNQKDRFFDLNSGKDLAEIVKYEKDNTISYDGKTKPKATLYYLDNFVSAKIFATYTSKKYDCKCYILLDEVDMATSQWVVWVPEPFRA
tara:strand:+ start:526 stop:864 length:339 start_codon:yes stop_codon:yes gene_type:complete